MLWNRNSVRWMATLAILQQRRQGPCRLCARLLRPWGHDHHGYCSAAFRSGSFLARGRFAWITHYNQVDPHKPEFIAACPDCVRSLGGYNISLFNP